MTFDNIDVGDVIIIHNKLEDSNDGSYFEITGKDGEKGFRVHCINGSWDGIYDPEMEILYIIFTKKVMLGMIHKIYQTWEERDIAQYGNNCVEFISF